MDNKWLTRRLNTKTSIFILHLVEIIGCDLIAKRLLHATTSPLLFAKGLFF
jgi:hypothetical protein